MILRHPQVILTIAAFMGMALDSSPAIAAAPWTEQAILTDFQTIGDVAVDGNLAVVGKSTSAIVYRRSADGSWTQEATLSSFVQSFSVAVNSDPQMGDLVVIGDMRNRVGIVETGAVLIYASDGAGTWSLQTTIRPAGLETGDEFGRQVAFDGQTLAASAPGDDSRGTDAGAVYTFERGAGWPQRDKILPPAGRGDIEYGFAVDVSGDRLVVGAQRDDSVATDAGTVFAYARQPDQTWTQQTELVGSGLAENFFFGRSVAIAGNTVVVGTPGTGAIGADPRAAYVFVEAGGWTQQAILQPPQFAAGGGQFGSSVDIFGNTAVVGAFRGNSMGFGSGSAWTFGRSGTVWNLEQELTASDGAANAWYGSSVAIDGATVVAAAALARASYVSVGSDYVFEDNTGGDEEDPDDPEPPQISLRAIEVNQAVQDWNNSITLVERKSTVVRVFVELLPGEPSRDVSGRLHGSRGGIPLPDSPLLPANDDMIISVRLFDAVVSRGLLANSLNFRLPPAWASGDLELTVELLDTADQTVSVACNEPDDAESDCAVNVSFQDTIKLDVKLISMGWVELDGSTHITSFDQTLEQRRRIESNFPLSRLDASFGYFPPYFGLPDLSDRVATDLSALRFLDLMNCSSCNEDIRYYGQLIGAGSDGDSGGYALGKVASGFVWTATGASRGGTGYRRNRSGHEVAHTLNIPHTVDPLISVVRKLGACGSRADADALTFPYHDVINVDANDDDVEEPGGERAPVIGPLNQGTDAEIWGFDTRYLDDDLNGLAVINPRETPPMMSYCGMGGPHGRWVSAFNYERLITKIANPGPGSGLKGGDADYLVLTGRFDVDGSNVWIEPAIEAAGTPLLPAFGNFSLELLDAAGTLLDSSSFEPITGDQDRSESGGATSEPRLYFATAIPKPAVPVAAIVLLDNGTEIGRSTASANAPTVAITAPLAGEALVNNIALLAWTGSDPDGDALTYTVRYTPDDGTTWTTLAVNTPREFLVPDRRFLTASPSARFQVSASDGVHTAVATSDFFAVAGNPPIVRIEQPTSNLGFPDGQNVIFGAFVYDPEDPSIDETSIAWRSDVDGALGTGSDLTLNTLTTGVHRITATATDSDGQNASDSIVLAIGVPAPEPNASPILAPFTDILIDEGGAIDLPFTATDEDGDFLVLTATGVPGFGTFTDQGNGSATLFLSPDYEDAGIYPVTVVADDGEGTAELTFVVTVLDVNRVLQCDIDLDGDVDRNDIGLIMDARNQSAAPGDPRDFDANGTINVIDARSCMQLCTLARCAVLP